jgi:hypothetical protein
MNEQFFPRKTDKIVLAEECSLIEYVRSCSPQCIARPGS